MCSNVFSIYILLGGFFRETETMFKNKVKRMWKCESEREEVVKYDNDHFLVQGVAVQNW